MRQGVEAILMQGQFIQVEEIEGGIYDVIFDRKDEDINKFDQAALEELSEAVDALNFVSNLKGVLYKSRRRYTEIEAKNKIYSPRLQTPTSHNLVLLI